VRSAAAGDPVASAGRSGCGFLPRKTVRVLVGVGAGGDYDVHARLLAAPPRQAYSGQSSCDPGEHDRAGGLKMANFLSELAPRDGTQIGVIGNYFPALQAAGGRGVSFDTGRFDWLGSLTRESQTMAVWHTTGVKTIDDARRREIVAAARAPRGAITYSFPAMMNAFPRHALPHRHRL
jgi:tripartite-type tricarboxylate transporter receptor subunit TctC